ncbi:glycosyltransferase family 2 protein [Pedobacter miscanthi]|uniref:Glycosyltransferase family 2 protein n=1 Tax=Pedobacter miscanthi TaxID=2259170 RepID=A0A366LD26_9SPHI|nr:glycosyltransferase family 2 protein [Pedobacter miscanthi]RBQ11798.1 glycosyltransferase family 2 protein [Pedobacter miscanthi]
MNNIFTTPEWINKYDFSFKQLTEVPESLFEEINARLDVLQTETPLVSIVIAAWNEEVNVIRNMASLANLATKIPLEIIVINNNSTDATQLTLDKLHLKSYFQQIQGCGPARQMGMEKARGKYILLADADCIYPECWLDDMLAILSSPGTVCVYGRYSFIPEPGFPRWKLAILEKMKDAVAALRHVKRPYLNAFGISMGYIREYGMKVGYVMVNVRGEDGRLCFDLMQFGKVRQLKRNRSRAWTAPRTLQRDGSFTQALFSRISIESKKLFSLFTPHKPHDTKKI